MCSRFQRGSGIKALVHAFASELPAEAIDALAVVDDGKIEAAPGSVQPVVVSNRDGRRKMLPMRWGFRLPDRFLFNTRSEGAESSRFWRDAFQQRRCLIPADAYFEWSQGADGRTKYLLQVEDEKLFGMAGLWSSWVNPQSGKLEETFSILTCEAAANIRHIHERQPVILTPEEYAAYLTPEILEPMRLLRQRPRPKLVAREAEEPRQYSLFDAMS